MTTEENELNLKGSAENPTDLPQNTMAVANSHNRPSAAEETSRKHIRQEVHSNSCEGVVASLQKHIAKLEEEKQKATENEDSGRDLDGFYMRRGCGTIESVSLKNFRSHKHLEIEFNDKLNFIVGKSREERNEIITALALGLGGIRSVPSGAWLRQFIYEGKTSADIVIRLKNSGPEAIEPKMFGERISVKLELSPYQFSYQLMNSDGDTISNSKQDVDTIISALNIHVDNPLTFLYQNTCRAFVFSDSPSEKYQYFFKATQLAKVKAAQTHVLENITAAKSTILNSERYHQEMEAEVRHLEKIYKLLMSLQTTQGTIAQVEAELAWALVQEKEKEVQRLKELFAQKKKSRKSCGDELQNIQQKCMNLADNVKQLVSQLGEVRCESASLAVANTEDQKHKRVLETHVEKLTVDICHMTNKKKSMTRLHANVVAELYRLKSERNPAAIANKKKKDDDHVAALTRKIKIQEHLINRKKEVVSQATRKIKGLEVKIETIHADIEMLRQARTELHKQLSTFQCTKGSKLQQLKTYCPGLIKEIGDAERAGQFQFDILGPLGQYIRVVDEKWTEAVETCLGELLTAFFVGCREDEEALQVIMEKYFAKETKEPQPLVEVSDIITQGRSSKPKHCEHIFKSYGSKPKYVTVMDVIEIDSPLAELVILSQKPLHTVLLFSDPVMCVKSMMRNPPNGVTEAFTTDGDFVLPWPHFRLYATSSEDGKRQTDVTRLMKETQGNFSTVTKGLAEKQTEERSAKALLKTARLSLKQGEKALAELEGEVKHMMQEKQAILTRRETSKTNYENLEHEEKWFAEETEWASEEEERLKAELKVTEGKLNEHIAKISCSTKRTAAVDDEKTEKERQLATAEEDFVKLTSDLQQLKDSMQKSKDDTALCKIQYASLKSQLDHLRTACLKQGPKPNKVRAKSQVNKDLFTLRREVEELTTIQKINPPAKKVLQQYRNMKTTVNHLENDINLLSSLCDELEEGATVRVANFTNFRKIVCDRVQIIFAELLGMFGVKGRLRFNHDKEELDLALYPQGHNTNTYDLKSLCSADRSFVSLCLLVALWNSSEAPFRIVDELDVFLKADARGATLSTLVDFCFQAGLETQLIFLTPTSVSSMKTRMPLNAILLSAEQEIYTDRERTRSEERTKRAIQVKSATAEEKQNSVPAIKPRRAFDSLLSVIKHRDERHIDSEEQGRENSNTVGVVCEDIKKTTEVDEFNEDQVKEIRNRSDGGEDTGTKRRKVLDYLENKIKERPYYFDNSKYTTAEKRQMIERLGYTVGGRRVDGKEEQGKETCYFLEERRSDSSVAGTSVLKSRPRDSSSLDSVVARINQSESSVFGHDRMKGRLGGCVKVIKESAQDADNTERSACDTKRKHAPFEDPANKRANPDPGSCKLQPEGQIESEHNTETVMKSRRAYDSLEFIDTIISRKKEKAKKDDNKSWQEISKDTNTEFARQPVKLRRKQELDFATNLLRQTIETIQKYRENQNSEKQDVKKIDCL